MKKLIVPIAVCVFLWIVIALIGFPILKNEPYQIQYHVWYPQNKIFLTPPATVPWNDCHSLSLPAYQHFLGEKFSQIIITPQSIQYFAEDNGNHFVSEFKFSSNDEYTASVIREKTGTNNEGGPTITIYYTPHKEAIIGSIFLGLMLALLLTITLFSLIHAKNIKRNKSEKNMSGQLTRI